MSQSAKSPTPRFRPNSDLLRIALNSYQIISFDLRFLGSQNLPESSELKSSSFKLYQLMRETMDTVNRLIEISSRIDHLESVAEWIARETVHTDNTVSQTGTLICVIADELRERLCALVKDLEKQKEYDKWN